MCVCVCVVSSIFGVYLFCFMTTCGPVYYSPFRCHKCLLNVFQTAIFNDVYHVPKTHFTTAIICNFTSATPSF